MSLSIEIRQHPRRRHHFDLLTTAQLSSVKLVSSYTFFSNQRKIVLPYGDCCNHAWHLNFESTYPPTPLFLGFLFPQSMARSRMSNRSSKCILDTLNLGVANSLVCLPIQCEEDLVTKSRNHLLENCGVSFRETLCHGIQTIPRH